MSRDPNHPLVIAIARQRRHDLAKMAGRDAARRLRADNLQAQHEAAIARVLARGPQIIRNCGLDAVAISLKFTRLMGDM